MTPETRIPPIFYLTSAAVAACLSLLGPPTNGMLRFLLRAVALWALCTLGLLPWRGASAVRPYHKSVVLATLVAVVPGALYGTTYGYFIYAICCAILVGHAAGWLMGLSGIVPDFAPESLPGAIARSILGPFVDATAPTEGPTSEPRSSVSGNPPLPAPWSHVAGLSVAVASALRRHVLPQSRKHLLLVTGGVGLICLLSIILLRGASSSHSGSVEQDARSDSLPPGATAVKVAVVHPPVQHDVNSSRGFMAMEDFKELIPWQNGFLKNMRCIKNTETGELTFIFDLTGWLFLRNGKSGWPMIVRLFDRNGNYLTHFMTQPFAVEDTVREEAKKALEIRELKKGTNTVSFSISIRDLRDTEYVEISFLDTAIWLDISNRPSYKEGLPEGDSIQF